MGFEKVWDDLVEHGIFKCGKSTVCDTIIVDT